MSYEKDQFTTFREARQKTTELRELAAIYRRLNRTQIAEAIESCLENEPKGSSRSSRHQHSNRIPRE